MNTSELTTSAHDFHLHPSTIVSSALPTIGSDLDAMSTASWVVTM